MPFKVAILTACHSVCVSPLRTDVSDSGSHRRPISHSCPGAERPPGDGFRHHGIPPLSHSAPACLSSSCSRACKRRSCALWWLWCIKWVDHAAFFFFPWSFFFCLFKLLKYLYHHAETYWPHWLLCTEQPGLSFLHSNLAILTCKGLEDCMTVSPTWASRSLLTSASCLSTAATPSSLFSLFFSILHKRFSSFHPLLLFNLQLLCLSRFLSSYLLHSAGLLLASNLHLVSSTSRCIVAWALWEGDVGGIFSCFFLFFACWDTLDRWLLSPAWDQSYFIVVCTAQCY